MNALSGYTNAVSLTPAEMTSIPPQFLRALQVGSSCHPPEMSA